jgi:hypothetical protein
MQRKRGGFLMACGLILLLCAGGWVCFQRADDEEGAFSEQAASEILEIVPTLPSEAAASLSKRKRASNPQRASNKR